MDTEDRGPTPPDRPSTGARSERWRRLSEELGAAADRANAEAVHARRERDRAQAQLRRLFADQLGGQHAAWVAERERQEAESELARARDYIARTQPVMRDMRTLLASMQASKFWQARNRWFALKKRAKLNPSGPQPHWVPELDDVRPDWEHDSPYDRWLRAHRTRPSDLQRMRDMLPVLTRTPLFSVIVPVYDAPEAFLREALDSVLVQVYPHWELCIADDASRAPHVRRVLEEYAARDDRVKVAFRATNGHISAASNTALELAGGEFVALLDHDDVLAPEALFENAVVVNRRPDVDIVYSDEDKIDEHGHRREPYFKPDWSPDSLLARNYVSHLGVYRRSLVEAVGGFRPGFEGSQDYDLLLRASERTDRIEHIPRPLYHWRVHAGSTATDRGQKNYAHEAAVRALAEALERRGEPGRVEESPAAPGLYTVRYALARPRRVSLIVPTRDHGEDVDLCLRSVFERSTYRDIEVVLLDNGSRDPASLRVFGAWLEREPERLKLIAHDVPFNFSEINNFAVARSTGEYLVFLNNDTEVITPDWIEAMMEQAQRPSVGAVGAKLLYDDGTIQHAGVIVGLGGVAGHSHKHLTGDDPGYFFTPQTVNNFSAVTAACLMVRREVYDEVGGLDERLRIAFNDVDFCLKIRAAGYYNVYLPHVELYHHESKSRGAEDTPEKAERFLREQQFMHERWQTAERSDPFYNRNLTLEAENYAIGN